jgi:hypothetical protein
MGYPIKINRQTKTGSVKETFQMKRTSTFPIYLGLVLLWITTSILSTQTASAAALSSIQIQPATPPRLLAGQTLQLTATGTYSDGSTADITSKVTWSISNTSVAKISATGLVSIVESAGGPGMPGMPGGPPPDGNFGSAGGPPPGQGDDGLGGRPRSNNSSRAGRPRPGGAGPADGPPPGGGPGGGGMPAGSVVSITATLAGVTSPPISLTVMTTEGPAIYSQSGGTASRSNQTITASDKNTSGVKVTDKGTFTLSDSNVTTSGNTTAMENSSFYGLNAAVLALSGSKITMTNGTITTSGTGANGAFAVGKGSVVELSKVKISCLASGAHGVDATIAGTIICTDVDITTAGNGAAAAISTDRGGGTVTFTRGSASTSGTRSPGIYSTGSITVSNARITATGSEAIVIEGKNSVTLTNTTLSCLRQCGAMLYQSFSGDAGVGTSILTMTGGSLTAAEGPMFYITNTSAVVDIKGDAKLSAASGTLINAAAGRWGNTGSNGGRLTFKADGEILTGDIVCDNVSSVTATLQNKTTLKGTINAEGTAKVMALTLDTTSIWEVTGTSYLTSLTDQDVNLANIHDNGHTIYYDLKADVNKWLGGKTWKLAEGGTLSPFGGPGFPPGGPSGPGNGPGGPDGNRPPPVEGGFETLFVSPIFGDNMVLQRGKPNTIWGWAKPGEEIRVTIADCTGKTVAKNDGRWSAVIEPPAPGGPYTIVIDGPQHVEFHDILVGDVWLCGGQSNMEMGLGQARNGSEEVKAADHPRIRLFVVKQQTARKPAAVPQGAWKVCSPKNVGEGWDGFSAVAYFFGRWLQQDIDVPIGLVEDCGGGTPAEAWTSAETLRSLGNINAGSGPDTPAILYNGMIAPVAPLAVSGAIWYQGESNTERAAQYRKLLAAMIADWRRAFGQGDFPFYIVSLAAHKQHKDTTGDDSWAELRAAQDFVANTVTNSGLAVAIDVGDARDVHPKDKKEVGERLALLALARHYGKNVPYSGPRFASVEKIPGALKISFTHMDGGLVVKGDKLEEFSVCGEDCKWHWADARIVGETVVVSSSEVPNPVAARYAWQANPKATLFNGAGLPAIPFRTDDGGGTDGK